jgi:hypothetical protein
MMQQVLAACHNQAIDLQCGVHMLWAVTVAIDSVVWAVSVAKDRLLLGRDKGQRVWVQGQVRNHEQAKH